MNYVNKVQFEDDNLNNKDLFDSMSEKEIMLLRACAKYLVQCQSPSSYDIITLALVKYSSIAKKFIKFFHAKFGCEHKLSFGEISQIVAEIEYEIEKTVQESTFSPIFRAYIELILAIKRTNYYKEGKERSIPCIALKISSNELSFLPLPKLYAEIFVYSPDFEGIHLRNGKVARGGIRWSDRYQDYRTEVLGLVQTQIVKNVIIIPTGAKGGFIVKGVDSSQKDTFFKKGVECYRAFLRGLLDITDNIGKDSIIEKPKQVHCYDEDDPYLVVAADKGTANFSDHANAISAEYKFWLGDAFASGGANGYNHKVIGITSRGAWISGVQHLTRLNIDVNRDYFTAIGIGGMSGDVFGNGVLLSQKMKLIAAFSHAYIFVDPNPDVEVSFRERRRLFDMDHSQWTDYDTNIISEGGGIFLRSSKVINISQQMYGALGINPEVKEMVPEELIRAILKAPVDLLINGGIGTYVKASREDNQTVSDKSNEKLRIDAKDLRVKAVIEGANLAFTQLGRVEYARNGGLINTDFVDNSGGVDCSDHEVNLKIFFATMLEEKAITLTERNELLTAMTEEVVQAVLENNYLQNQILSIEESKAVKLTTKYQRFITDLENQKILNRKLEKLPNDEELQNMLSQSLGLTRPEIAILIAYAKSHMVNILKNINFKGDSYFQKILFSYFPKELVNDQKFSAYIPKHKLANEIIAVILTNDFVNTLGCLLFYQLSCHNMYDALSVIEAFIVTKYGLKLGQCWKAVEGLRGKIGASVQLRLFDILQNTIEQGVGWLLYNKQKSLGLYRGGIGEFVALCVANTENLVRIHAGGNIKTTMHDDDFISIIDRIKPYVDSSTFDLMQIIPTLNSVLENILR
ncbi:glutamate dehydrogenase [Alphaproteobacteria bacterium]